MIPLSLSGPPHAATLEADEHDRRRRAARKRRARASARALAELQRAAYEASPAGRAEARRALVKRQHEAWLAACEAKGIDRR